MLDDEFVTYLLDQLPYHSLSKRKLFGSYCLFFEQKIVAIIDDDNTIFIKTSHQTLKTFTQHQAKQFRYGTKKGDKTLNFWSIPETDIDDENRLAFWIELGIKAIYDD